MRFLRLHKKVFIWFNDWFAFQFVQFWNEFGLGVWIEPKRPLLDIYLFWFTFSFGKHPVLTDPRTKYRHRCRGFLIDEEIL